MRVVVAALVASAVVVGVASASGPRSGLVSFWSDRGGFPGAWVMNADGSNPRLVSGKVWAKRPSWSPDGRRIVFDGPQNVASSRILDDFDLYVANADGSGRHRITHGPQRDVLAAWSPDGGTIAFTRRANRNAVEEVWLVRPDGRGLRRLARGAAPVWSPDSGSIAFARLAGRRYAIFTIAADGTNLRRLTTSETDDGPTDWSRDGRLLFTRWRLGEPGGDVWVLDRSTGRESRLTRTPADDFDATWSPDGRRILFTSDRAGSKDVWLMNADGSKPRALTRGPAEDWATDWQPRVR